MSHVKFTLFHNVGLDVTIRKIRELIHAGHKNPITRMFALKLTQDEDGRDFDGMAKAVYDWLIKNIKYHRDPVGVEWLQDAENTIRIKAGDCDDFTIAACTLLGSLGIATRIVISQIKEPRWNHVFAEYYSPKQNKWIAFDACVKKFVGWKSPNIIATKSYPV